MGETVGVGVVGGSSKVEVEVEVEEVFDDRVEFWVMTEPVGLVADGFEEFSWETNGVGLEVGVVVGDGGLSWSLLM